MTALRSREDRESGGLALPEQRRPGAAPLQRRDLDEVDLVVLRPRRVADREPPVVDGDGHRPVDPAGVWRFTRMPLSSTGLISMKSSLLLTAPAALVMVSRPSLTITVLVPSKKRLPLVGLPLTTSTPSTLTL